MHIEVIEIEFSFYMLPEFESEALEIWGAGNLDAMLKEIAESLYKGNHIGANLWKVRVKAKGKGKRGGARIIYMQFNEDRTILLIEVYSKNDKEDLAPDEEKELVEFANGLNIKGVLDHGKGKVRRIKAKVKNRRGFQSRQAEAAIPQGKGKGAGRKKD